MMVVGRPGLLSWGLTCPVLSCSSSVRLPASMLKLGEKLERYHTAVQVGGALTGGNGTCQVCV